MLCVASVASGWPEVTAGLLTEQLHTWWSEQDTLEPKRETQGPLRTNWGQREQSGYPCLSFTASDPRDTGDLSKELESYAVNQSTYMAPNSHILQVKKEFAVDYLKL